MTENITNIFEPYEFPPEVEPKYTNFHVINGTPREIYLTFGVGQPQRAMEGQKKNIRVVAQIILTKEHLQELVLNLQTQLKNFGKQAEGPENPPKPSGPPKGRF